MSDSIAPQLAKWPFFLGDLALIIFTVYLVEQSPSPLSTSQAGICLAAILTGAWLAVVPFLRDHRVAQRVSEAHALRSTVAQIGDLEQIKAQIVGATAQWKGIQQHSDESLANARDLSSRMKSEVEEFCEFLKRANDSEKAHLKLEVEKFRKNEAEWLQATVHILDHVFALHKAASRSGQPALATQVDHFQFACRDIVRRLGLASFAPANTETFNPERHQMTDSEAAPPQNSAVTEALALGYTFQGRLVRRALVRVEEVSPTAISTEDKTGALTATHT